MDVTVSALICFFLALVKVCSAAPPDVCYEEFKWEDCGLPPKAVIYHYKSGSRCEVGFWRGCLPNPNMFEDEYECVQTCIFSPRARPHDFHQFQDNVNTASEEVPTTVGLTTDNDNTTGNVTGSIVDADNKVEGEGNAGGEGEGEAKGEDGGAREAKADAGGEVEGEAKGEDEGAGKGENEGAGEGEGGADGRKQGSKH